jgi:hypothetical protein
VPKAHSAVHISQALHPVTAQSVGHAVVAQIATSVVPEHACPPPEAAAWTERVRCRDLDPHVAEHAPQTCQEPTEQSTGQVNVEQLISSVRGDGHCAPPSLAAASTERTRLVWPPPQLAVHVAHAAHEPVAQSTGQVKVLQDPASSVAGQAVPAPPCGCTMLRERARDPASQLREQLPQIDHAPTTQ